MPDPRQLDDQEAAKRRHAWLEERHASARELVVLLLRHAPEVEVARALDLLSAGELQRLARLLAQATDLHQVARRIAIDLQEHLDAHPAGMPPDQPGPSGATRTRP